MDEGSADSLGRLGNDGCRKLERLKIPEECMLKMNKYMARVGEKTAELNIPQYFFDFLGDSIRQCAEQLPATVGVLSGRFLEKKFRLCHDEKISGCSRMMGIYTESLFTLKHVIQASQTAWPELPDEVIKRLLHKSVNFA